MKMIKMKPTLSILLITIITFYAQAQGWNWGEQVDLAKEKNVLYTDALKAKKYPEALEPLNWLLTNTPDLNPSIYINGVKIYQALAKSETNPAKKEEYIQKGLELHDTRVKYFKKEGSVADRKSTFAYKFYSKDKTKYPYLYELYNKAFELNGDKMNSGNLVAYMNVIYKFKFAKGDISDEQVIEKYSAISDALTSQKGKVKDEKKKKRYTAMLGQVDKLLAATGVTISCEMIETKFGPKLDAEGNLNMAKKIFGLMLKGKCLKSPLALKAAGIIQNSEPTYGVAKFMAQKNGSEGNVEEAEKYYKEAAELTSDNSEKAEAYFGLAKLQASKKMRSQARSSARRALSFDGSLKAAYKLIGDLYMTSFNTCKQEKSQVQDRAIFIAAYNEYSKAGNAKGMSAAKAQFPQMSDIFNEGKKVGDAITVGCWINTTVKLDKRPN